MTYEVRIRVDADEQQAARLRSLLPALLREAGYETSSNGTVIAAWLVDETNRLGDQAPFSGKLGQADTFSVAGRKGRGSPPNA